MNRLAIVISALITTSPALAGSSAILPGSLSTTGPTSDHHSMYAATLNPALADLAINQEEKWRFNYFAGVGANVEIGDANGFLDELDDLIDILDDPSVSTDSIDTTLSRFNNVLADMGDEGYVKSSTRVYLPGLPVYYRPGFIEGTVFAEVAFDTQWRLTLLDDELRFNDQNGSFETNSSAYIKSGIQQRISLGYGRELFSDVSFDNFRGRLLAGAKLNFYRMELSKQLMQLQTLDGKDIDQVIKDEYENNLVSSTALGLDAGIVWTANHYRVGFTVTDINSPEFEYGTIGANCEALAESSVQRSSCELTRYFTESTGEILAKEVHTKHATATIDASIYPLANWSISSAYELAAYDDIVGTENQWVSLSTAYNPNSTWIPAVRVGMHKNLVGSELTSYGLGMTLFKILSLDVATSSETVVHDGTEIPRRFSFSLSIEESF